MGKRKTELFSINEDGSVYCHYWHLESSAIFKFINFKFSLKDTDDKIISDIYKVLRYDDLVSPRQYFYLEELKYFKDFVIEPDELVLYFTILQEELKSAFEYLVDFFSNHNGVLPLSFAYSSSLTHHQGPFQFLGHRLYELGKLEYEANRGNLILYWDNEVTSFEQILIRSLIGFMQQGGVALKYICQCQNSFEEKIIRKPAYEKNRFLECGKFYFNIDGNDKFCSRICRKRFHDTIRDQSDRHNSITRYNYLEKKAKAKKIVTKQMKKQKNRLT